MNSELLHKINDISAAEPYVWRLRLSESEFKVLESTVTAVNRDSLLTEEWAKAVIVYMAEWYKRRYKAGLNHDALNLSSTELESVWKSAGFSIKRLVYRDAAGNRRWQYSTYVLGGLAIRHELGRNDKRKFLKAICRLYHHENYTIENLDDEARAISFRESIQREHSLYYYLQEILNGNMPFSEDDLKDASSEVNRFIFEVKTANDEVMRKKFRLEWIVSNIPNNPVLGRKLRLWLKPEEVNEGLHQYLRFDRVQLWGVKEPEAVKELKIGIQFYRGEQILNTIDWEHPLINYLNTGDSNTGFVSVGVAEYATCHSLPTRAFTKLSIIAKDNEGNEYIAQEEECNEYMQLWRIAPGDYLWSSTQSAQHETALIFTDPWQIKLESLSEIVESKPFKDKQYGLTSPWFFYNIYDSATISNGKQSITFYNRQGYCKISTHLYNETIKYINGGYINYFTEDEYGDMQPQLLPLIFRKEDVIVRHFNTKDDILNAQPDTDIDAELIEFKDGGFYKPWTESDTPSYGQNTLRVTVKGHQELLEVCYLPGITDEQPIIRDFDSTCIKYMKFKGDMTTSDGCYLDEIVLNKQPLDPTVTIKVGYRTCYAEIYVWRPILHKEVMMDNTIIRYLKDGEELNLPYIYKRRVCINDFSRDGYRNYNCANLRSIYSQDFINISGNPSAGMAALSAWEKGNRYGATLLDPLAPSFLFVNFGKDKIDIPDSTIPMLFWNYNKDITPKLVSIDYAEIGEWGIIFQDLSENQNLECYYPAMNDNDLWEWDEASTSIEKCFEIATTYGIYYFEMMPLRELSQSDYVGSLYRPLVEARNGFITEEDREGLRRFSEEFGFDWKDLNINIDNE